MVLAAKTEETERVNANCILMANLQQASTSGTQTDEALVYDSNGSAEDDSNVILRTSSVAPNKGEVEHHPATIEETRACFESLYNNLIFEVEKVNTKFLDEVKDTIMTLQRVIKSRMSLNVNNWSSTVHQEVHKILKDVIAPIINQVNARVINFEKQLLKEAAKFFRDFKSLASEAVESLTMNKVLKYKNERLLRAVQASTSGTQTDEALVYDSNGSAEDDSNVILRTSSVAPNKGEVEHHPATIEETRACFESLYNNLIFEVEKVNTVTSPSYGFMWSDESRKHQWEAYVLVIVDDYSRYTWVYFLRSNDEAPEEIKAFLNKIKVLLQAPVIIAPTIPNTSQDVDELQQQQHVQQQDDQAQLQPEAVADNV
nr:ribonuclease H-like domain-containing protein [Tanacetum cinerariifolium]